MPKTLLDAFSDAKKGRQVLSKTVISESGVSKSQFYRILSGKESPSSETKKRISKSLGIETAQFDILHRQSGLDQTEGIAQMDAQWDDMKVFLAVAREAKVSPVLRAIGSAVLATGPSSLTDSASGGMNQHPLPSANLCQLL